ncbi:MAG: hypothetical protein K7J46_06325 [Bryobacter sp.]|jgi:hypothetical protein|nr:hypothetical protein [Bryobacter sp. CoA8 C33]
MGWQLKVVVLMWALTAGLWGQPGIVEGRLVRVKEGAVEVELGADQRRECAVDGRTYIDRERQRMELGDLRAGDLLELVTEKQGVGGRCFARMIHVVGQEKRFGGRGKVGVVKRSTESFAPRGSLVLTGLVRSVDGVWLELRTRQEGTMRLRLRPDTAFVNEGQEVGREGLERQTAVSVRAGYDLSGELEVFQVSWGGIVQPQGRIPRQ